MNSTFEFDFDEWAELARRDPDAFVRRRDRVVEETCERMVGSSHARIAGICWRIEIERKRSTSPMQLCLKLSSLMWKRHSDMVNSINALDEANQKLQQLWAGRTVIVARQNDGNCVWLRIRRHALIGVENE